MIIKGKLGQKRGFMATLTPYSYQVRAATRMNTGPHWILGADLGTGKTVMALLAMQKAEIKKLLVICPAIAVANWQREAQRLNYSQELVVYSYDKARQKKTFQELRQWSPDGVVLDEAHYLKNPDAQRTQMVYGTTCSGEGGLVEHAKKVLALSGTIAPNNAAELYPHLKYFCPDVLKNANFWQFREYFCQLHRRRIHNRTVVSITGNKNVEDLKKLLAPIYIPLRAASVLKDLPPITYRTAVLDAGRAMAALKEIDRLVDQSRKADWYQILMQLDELDLPMEERKLPPMTDELARIRRLIGEVKVPLTVEYIKEMLAGSQEKIIVFAYHRNVIDELLRGLTSHTKVARISGSTSLYQRNRAMEMFRTDPECRVFLGQIQACGTAITLNVANHVLFVEQSWVPAENYQASKRCHRIGQDKPVFVTNLMLANSIDVQITNTLAVKTARIKELGLCA